MIELCLKRYQIIAPCIQEQNMMNINKSYSGKVILFVIKKKKKYIPLMSCISVELFAGFLGLVELSKIVQ